MEVWILVQSLGVQLVILNLQMGGSRLSWQGPIFTTKLGHAVNLWRFSLFSTSPIYFTRRWHLHGVRLQVDPVLASSRSSFLHSSEGDVADRPDPS